jgi:uncharacterized protein YyaL (SSP411 family)
MARAQTKPNRLAHEASPYLLQHARNPVDWYAWGDEAFAAARARNVPIFLSIGYSTCYWCHVMERESFENDAIAAQMNEHFVCVKVDREERPDVDDLYMAATIVMTGRGGWPMSVFLDPVSLRPFYCGTYFPAEPRHAGIPTFPKLLEAMSGVWKQQREAAIEQAGKVADAVREQTASRAGGVELGQEPVAHAVSGLLRTFDRVHGGFGRAPKFPQPVFLDLLLDVRARAADDSTADAIDECLRRTLDAMALGGVRDQIGGGFHRYSVDEKWLVPHFEKMLYDNAQLASVYARASGQYGDAFYADIAQSTCDYVLREMTHEQGGFFSAQDAEVDGREGLNYLWTAADISGALCPPEVDAIPALAAVARNAVDLASRVFGVAEGPNFQDPHHPEEPRRSVLFLQRRPEKLAADFQLSPADFSERLSRIAAAMYEARSRRTQPHMDDKVLAAWNGLMIGALATCAGALGAPRYLAAAEKAADFVLAELVKDGRLHRSWRDGRLGPPGVLEDSACMIHGLLALARQLEGPARERRITQARELLSSARAAFFDAATGAMYDTREHAPNLFVRARSTHDGALPSAASVMVNALIDLAELTGDPGFAGQALASLDTYSGEIAENPVGACNSVRALLRLLIASESGQLAPASDHAQGAPASPLRPLRAADVRDQAAEEIRAQRAARERATTRHGTEVVEIFAGIDRIRVAPAEPAELQLVVRIAEGWHVTAADPGASDAAKRMIPFRVAIINGSGVAAYADYPDGQPQGVSSIGTINAYRGTIELRVALERTGEWKGTPILCVMYQACSDHECLAPTTVELDIAIDP